MARWFWNGGDIKRRQARARDRAVYRQAEAVVLYARRIAVVRTGEHRDSIGTVPPGQDPPNPGHIDPADVRDGGVRIGAGAPHSFWVERGTSRMPPRPAVAPAADAEAPNFQRRLREEYRKEGL